MEDRRKHQFAQLKPLCVALSNNVLAPPKQRLQRQDAIYKSLKDVLIFVQQPDLEWSKNLADYIFFPIMHLLQGITIILDLRDSIRELVLAVLDVLISKVWSLDMNQILARELLSLTANLSSGDDGNTSDETRLMAAHCFRGILPSKPELNDVGPIVLLLLQWGEKGGSLDLREQSWLALLALFNTLKSEETAQILPGVVSAVSKVVNGHYRVAVASLRVLRQVTVTALENKACPNEDKKKWLEYTRKQYLVTLKTISTRKHQQTNSQLILLCSDIIGKCNESLSNCLPVCVEILLSLDATDEFFRYQSKLTTVLDERMYVWLDNLPSLLTRNDDTEPLAILKCLTVGMRLLQFNSRELLIEKLVDAFNSISQNTITSTESKQPSSASTDISFVKHQGINTRQVQVNHITKHVMPFQSFGLTTLLNGDVQSALEALVTTANISFQDIQNASLDQGSQLWLSNLMLLQSEDWLVGMNEPDKLDVYELESYFIDALNTPTQQYQYLALQGIGLLSTKTELDDSLMDILYPILALVPSNHKSVSEMARQTLSQLSSSCGYSSIQNMMVANADYLVDSISLAIQTMDISPGTFQILTILIKLTGSEIVSYLDDVVATLFRLLDNYHSYPQLVESVIAVFNSLIEVMDTSVTFKRIEPSKPTSLTVQSVLEELEERKKRMEATFTNNDDKFEPHPNQPFGEATNDEEKAKDEGSEPEPQWTGTLPKPTYALVKQIFGYVQNLITSDSSKLVVSLCRLVCISAPLLAGIDEDQQSEYLPCIHELYPLLESESFSENIFIAESCLKAITVLAKSVDPSFMRPRMVELFPKLLAAFDSLLKESSPDHKTRRANSLITCMTVLIGNVKLPTLTLIKASITCRDHLAHNKSREVILFRQALETAKPDVYNLFSWGEVQLKIK